MPRSDALRRAFGTKNPLSVAVGDVAVVVRPKVGIELARSAPTVKRRVLTSCAEPCLARNQG